MNNLLNIPLRIQEKRAKEANMPLHEWQIMIINKIGIMREAAIIAEQHGKFLLENGLIAQEDVDRMMKKMQSAFPEQKDKENV